MRSSVIIILISCSLLLTGCGSSTPAKTIKKMATIKSEEEAKQCYTKRTVELMDELESLTPKDDSDQTSYRTIQNDADWNIVSEKIEGDAATVTIRVVSESAPSGIQHTMKMKKEESEWKIDMEEELESGVTALQEANQAVQGLGDAMQAIGGMFGTTKE